MKKNGFTLVELSIVLVIIGLIVGGVVGGQALIASARIGAQVQQLNQHETAYRAFQLQYDAIPGDMIDASDYWAGATNGDGNNRITDSANSAHSIPNENLAFFEHLSLAKIIPETYINVWTLGQGYPALEINKGKGMIAGGQIYNGISSSYQISQSEVDKQHIAALYLNVARPTAVASQYNDGSGVMTPSSAKNIDKKMDDGVARTGKFLSHSGLSSGHIQCLDGVDGDYLVSNDEPHCLSVYVLE
jgi:prepilin-type N-terminal cleavage/methylation domain-containing protein